MKRWLIAALALAAVSVQAEDAERQGQWRLGAGAAFGQFETDDKIFDDSQVGFQFTGGYRFNNWFGIEGGYLNTGDFEVFVPAGQPGSPIPGGGTGEISYSGFHIGVIGFLPTPSEQVELFGKVGFYDFDGDLKVNGVTESSGSIDGAMIGGGATINIAERWAIRAEFDWFDVDAADLWTVILGGEYRF